MKKVKTEVEQYMSGFAADDKVISSRFMFPEEFVGFQGHFPQKKILPGVCHIQCALSTLEKAIKKPAVLAEITMAKYLAPVLPNEEITCVCSDLKENNGQYSVKAAITRGSDKVSEFKLKLRFTEGNNGSKR